MIDFVEYIVAELSSRRLSKNDALDLIRQYEAGAEAAREVVGSLRLRNTSGFDQQSYEAVFDGDEPFLRDHVVKGHRVLPGVVYLELVRQALADALPEAADATLEFRNVVWAQPIVVDARTTVSIALFPADTHERDGAIDYEIYSLSDDGTGAPQERIHAQGQVVSLVEAEAAPHRDFAALRAKMTRGRIDGERLYAAFDAFGMAYGPAQRAVRRLHQGQDEVLAHLVLPEVWGEADAGLRLHPAIMDGALQSLLGFIEDIDTVPARPRLPYALDRLRIHAPCTGEMVAWLRLTPGQGAQQRVTRIDIDLCDAEGRVCVEWRGFTSRELGASADVAAAATVLYGAPRWEDRATTAPAQAEVALTNASVVPDAQCDRRVLLCGGPAAHASALVGVQATVLADAGEVDAADRYREVALAVFDRLRACFAERSNAPVLFQLVVGDDAQGELLLGLAGLLRSAMLESPRLQAQIVMVPADTAPDALGERLARAARLVRDTVLRFDRDGGCRAQVWREVQAPVDAAADAPAAPVFRAGGVYLITGGLGGLGALFAREILATVADAKVVLTGRAAPGAEVDARLEALSLAQAAREGAVAYRGLDLADAGAVRAVVDGIVRDCGRLDGVLHCAGCLRDALVPNQTHEDIAAVLEPKVAGTRHLDDATRDLDLDFIVLFSGGASVTGNAGQTAYAAANGFMDRYAAHRNALAERGERRGIARAINWPFWREGGMRASADTLARAERLAGLQPLDTAAGMTAFARVLALAEDQVQVVQGDPARLRRALFAADDAREVAVAPKTVQNAASVAASVAGADAVVDGDALRASTSAFLRQRLAGLLKLPADQIETDAPLEKYGINSIMMMNLTNVLEETFGSLPKTLFFEYQTLDELTGYFVSAHAATLARTFGARDRDATADAAGAGGSDDAQAIEPRAGDALVVDGALPSQSRAARRRRRFASVAAPGPAARRDEPVAIVGLSGRYPGARDLDAFWRNLRDGVDSIVEVPADRWDWRDYFTDDRSRAGHHYSKWGGFIEGVDEFDALFFNIPPVEAERIDPQERLFLEHAWMAVEDAGYTRAGLQIPHENDQSGQVGVYVGVMYGEYQMFGVEASLLGRRGVTPTSYASIANRVSYFMNLHGPSMALDTMCSSSLTAIHLACQDLREGRTDLAIAGGVNVTIHPNKYLMLSSGQFIATEGRCQSFGVGGDGYIPAEGVGAVVLKRLSEAERDGNHIHGLILASALNHGGKTNGYSVPNPQSQAGVIARALRASGVDPRRIGYLEAHGTGTKLGDPIEIAALTQAFRRHTAENGFCLIGSAKSNIGHAESAAGIAGLTKILLQMKHGMVAPSLHATVLNPHIDFANTPFEVNRALRPWTPVEVDGRPLPRLAGLSSFGAGGSNAHLVVEEYVPRPRATRAAGPQIVVLSARTDAQLEQKARDLLAFLERTGPATASQAGVADARRDAIALDDLAWTLQIGREAMEERLAFVVDGLDALRASLRDWLDAPASLAGGHRARATPGGGALALFNTDNDLQTTLERWFATGRHDRIADLWVNGVAIDWRRAHAAEAKPRLIGLPTYPFARERCWIDRPAGRVSQGDAGRLHPLVHVNVSDLHAQAYRSTFHGNEFFLDDHRVRFGAGGDAQRLQPGVAYLEMMRAAAVLALPEWDGATLELRDIAWARPLAVAAPTAVTVAIAHDEDGDLALRVVTAAEDDEVVHCTGKVRGPDTDEATAPVRHDPAPLRARMDAGTLAGDDLYARYAALGVEYGRSFRSVERVLLGRDEVFAELQLPQAASDAAFGLSPALLDGALQSAIGLIVAAGRDLDRMPLPFALRTLRVLAPCASRMWAWVRYVPGRGHGASVVELDIDVCAEDGTVCAELRGLASRPVRGDALQPASVLLAVPAWERVASPSLPAPGAGVAIEVMLCDVDAADADALAAEDAARAPLVVVSNATAGADLAARYTQHAQRLLVLLRDGAGAPAGAQRRLQVVVGDAAEAGCLAGLDAMLRTAAMEQPAFRGQIVQMPAGLPAAQRARVLREASALAHEPVLAWHDGALRARRWQALADDAPARDAGVDAPSPFREDGVYLITGGMGGLGRLFAAHLLARSTRARVVLSGRAVLDDARRAQFDALDAGSGRLHYRVVDLDDDGAVCAFVAGLVAEFGALHGIVHAAGFSRDGLLSTRTEALLADVFAPKVAATVRLDAATADLDLDFFALFASVSGALGNVGQADYAAANGFLDRFAAHRRSLVDAGRRRGHTVSIDWPLWAEGGMGLEPAAIELLWTSAGVRPLSTADGLRAFERSLLDTRAAQVLVLSGDPQRLRRLLETPPKAAAAIPQTPVLAQDGDREVAQDAAVQGTPEERAQGFLRDVFSRVLKVPAHRIDVRASLEHYGIDSVIAMSLTNALEQSFGDLPKTLLFEHQTIERLARHLLATFPQRMHELTGASRRETPARASAPVASAAPRPRTATVPNRFAGGSRGEAPRRERQVAIVGVAGRYPQADSIDMFWDNLRSGRDCIAEVPDDRWDHARYFDTARNRPGRTYSKWGGFLDDIGGFDALFFNVSPREAELMDPQERLFLETAWEAIEDAGYGRERLAGRRIGVYVGVMWSHYELYGGDGAAGIPTSSHASIANRVSYFFDFQGPSLGLDTMCSSSLTAIHLAAEDVRRGVVEAAIAGGVNLSLHPQKYLNLSQGNFMSSDGRCRSFGAGGDGYVPGEGVGALLIKPLDEALRDGDHVYAVIEASALNHGGKTHGYTVPNPVAQAALIRDTLRAANLDPRSLDYIETHGTGTSLGDPIELAGLRDAFAGFDDGEGLGRGICAIGSVKSNIGHLEAAAGVAAVTKTLLQLRHGELVPSLHAEPANPHIDFASSPFRVQTRLAPWPRRDGQPRRAAVSAFGAGGANAHIILAEAPAQADVAHTSGRDDANAGPELFLLSARDEAGLVRYAERVAAFLAASSQGEGAALRDIAHTSRVGRTALPVRLAVLATTTTELRDRLARWASAQSSAAASGTLRASGVEDLLVGRVVDAGAGALIPGESGQAFLGELIDREDWRTLARLWVAGAEVDWTPRKGAHAPKRVRLPTYPFAREHYWIGGSSRARLPQPASVHGAPAPTSAMPGSAAPETLLYRPTWTERPLPATAASPAVAGPVLLIGATPAQRDALSARLGGATTILATMGDAFAERTADHFILDPTCEDDADRLVEALHARGALPRVVVQWHAGLPGPAEDAAAATRALAVDAHVPAALARALIAHHHHVETRFLSLVSGPDAAARALGVAIGGFHASLHREQPKYLCRVVELVDEGAQAIACDPLSVVVDELADGGWGCDTLRLTASSEGRALRRRRGWTAHAPAASANIATGLKRNGVYLITGGMGALGRLFAESLAREQQARLVLLGRSPSGPSIEAFLQSLHALGGEAIYVQAEIADATQAESAVRAAKARFGRIDGVLHAAGLHRDAYLLRKTREDRAAVFAPKILGALHLDHATRDEDLDLFVLFASVSGALGNAGQTDYAFANRFLDAFAEARTAQVAQGTRRGRTLSIDWPLWAADGMRPHEDVVAASAGSGLWPLPPDAGLQAWRDALQGDAAQVMVLHGDADRIAGALRALDADGAPAPMRADVAPTAAVAAGTAVAASRAAGDDLATQTREYLLHRIGEEIRLDPARVDPNERFDAFGIDSMMVSRLNERLGADLGELPKTLFYEYSTVVELAAHLVREVPAALSALFASDAAQTPVRETAPVATVASAPLVPASAAPAMPPMASSTLPVADHAPTATIATPAPKPSTSRAEPIAIIGMHGRYPQSPDLGTLWKHLQDGRDLVGVVPANRWDAEAFHDPDPANAAHGRIYCKWGAFLDDHDAFDAAFFRIAESEACSIDPQERVFLESVWAAFEDAGITRDALRRRYPKGKGADAGVFVGVTSNTYHLLDAEHWQDGDGPSLSALPWSIANRVSYVFDLQGPSLPIDAACSSSLVAIHMACESLRRGECRVAVAGGVNLYLHPAKYHGLCQRRMLAEHGRCRSYGAGDDGFVPGEGVGSLILKPLAQARADGDRIHGVILASGHDHGGRSNRYSAPNPGAQAALVAEVLRRADIDAAGIGYVEGHGTGTQLGDSLEVRALSQAFGEVPAQSCRLGSIKANLGHTESAAGVLGVSKVLLQMRHRRFVPSLHAEPVNPDIAFERTPFRLCARDEAWEVAPGQRRRALINAFGAGGVNACLVLEEYAAPVAAAVGGEVVFVLSASSEERLRAAVADWVGHLRRTDVVHDLPAIARTLQLGREAMAERIAVVADTAEVLAGRLEAWLKGEASVVYRGNHAAGRGTDCSTDQGFSRQDEGMLTALVQARDLHGIAREWVCGTDVPWRQVSADLPPPAVALPTYPFARTRYWPKPRARREAATSLPVALSPSTLSSSTLQLHPLVSHNASHLWETRYTSILSRDAFYARDHRVDRQPMLPGSAWLEIARAAGGFAAMREIRRLRDVVFVRPLAFVDPVQVAVTSLRVEADDILCTIASHDPILGPVVHCECVLDAGEAAHADAERRIALGTLMQAATRSLDDATCYARFGRSGIDYGPTFRTIRSLHIGDGFVLGRLSLDASLIAEAGEYGLHPSLIDGALQTIAGFADGEAGSDPVIPFAIDEIAVHGVAPADCFAYARECASTRAAAGRDGLRKFDIDLATEEGLVVVSLRGLTVRSLKSRASGAAIHSGTRVS